jgi:hypothetical protein
MGKLLILAACAASLGAQSLSTDVSTSLSFFQALSSQSMNLTKSYTFGTGCNANVTNMTQLAASFDPYGIAGTGTINQEWEVYQNFTAGAGINFVFTATTLNLTATIPPGGGLFAGGINSGQIWTKATYTPGFAGVTVVAQEVVMQIPHGKGSWPAAWWYMKNASTPFNFPQADGSEIDNPEFFVSNTENTFDWTGYSHPTPRNTQPNFYQIPGMTDQNIWHPGTDFANAFHSFQTYWTLDAVYRYVDGQLVKANSFTWGTGQNPAQFGIDLAVGTGSCIGCGQGQQPTSLSEFPMPLQVKSVKIWTK